MLTYLRALGLILFWYYSSLFSMYTVERFMSQYEYISIPELFQKPILSEQAMDYIAQRQRGFYIIGEVVLYKQQEDSYQFAMATRVLPAQQQGGKDHPIEIYLFHHHRYMKVDESELRTIAPFWCYMIQPFPLFENMVNPIQWYHERFSLRNDYYLKTHPVKPGETFLVLGDIHGYVDSLVHILLQWYRGGFINKNFKLKEGYSIIGTGDYEDRGDYGVPVWYLLLMLTKRNLGRVYLLRGNHEEAPDSTAYFYKEWTARYGDSKDSLLGFNLMAALFNRLPLGLLLGAKCYDEQLKKDRFKFIFCCHGGLPVEFGNFAEIMQYHATCQRNPALADWDTNHIITAEEAFAIYWTDYFAPSYKEAQDGTGYPIRQSLRTPGCLVDLTVQAVRDFMSKEGNGTYAPPESPFICQLWSIIRGHQHVAGVTKLREIKEKRDKLQPETEMEDVVNAFQPLEPAREHTMEQAAVYNIISSRHVYFDQTYEWPDCYAVMHPTEDGNMLLTPAYCDS